MSNAASPLILLPGLGATAEQFAPQRAAFPQLVVPEWLAHEPGESLPAYARRMSAVLPVPRDGRPYLLGGASFGGMIALEAARHLDPPPRALLLIASGRSGDCIAPHLRYFVEFAHVFPERAFEAGLGATPLFMQKFGRLTPEQQSWFGLMLAGVDAKFVRWGIEAITKWAGCEAPPGVPVHHIHGSDDELIPCERVQSDRVIPGGGHLINVTHAGAVNEFIAARTAL